MLVNDATNQLSLASAIDNRQIMYLEMISEAAVAVWAGSCFLLATALRNNTVKPDSTTRTQRSFLKKGS